jgi:hypothetical protein
MGTSSSGGGPSDKTPLLPDWALPGGGSRPSDDEGVDGDAGAGGDSGAGAHTNNETEMGSSSLDADGAGGGASGGDDSDSNQGGPDDVATQDSPPSVTPGTPPGYWASAKRSLGSAASSQSGRSGVARAGRAYVRARGGPGAAAHSAASARAATARLGGFLSNVAARGVLTALESLGLARFAGRDAHVVFAAIVDALAPEGSELEQSATRVAIEQTLAGLFEEYVTPDGSVAALEAMTPEAIRSALEAAVAATIFNRWLGDLERVLETKSITAVLAIKLERDMESYISETVKLDLKGKDPLTVQWDGPEGAQFVDRIYQDAYSILGIAR